MPVVPAKAGTSLNGDSRLSSPAQAGDPVLPVRGFKHGLAITVRLRGNGCPAFAGHDNGEVSQLDKNLAAFHRKLTAAGKPKMVVRIALARKLLVRLNAKAREAREQYALAT